MYVCISSCRLPATTPTWRNVRPTSQHRAVSPAALFSAAPTAADDDDFLDFSHDVIFFINILTVALRAI